MNSMPDKKILLVDGYNVINRVPELRAGMSGGLENARNRLALQVSKWGQAHPQSECIIVFDGDPQYAAGRDQRLAGIRCLYSRTPHGCDDEMIRFIKNHRGRTSDITVVSDDNYVGNNCRAYGASVRPSSHIMIGNSHHTKSGRKTPADGKGIDRRSAAEINKELKKTYGL
jgi:predicted RNA-binding protein with PIN domain